MRPWICALLLAGLPLCGGAEMYRWVDEKGQVHYTQTPPKQGSFDRLGPAPEPAAAPNQEQLNQSLKDERQRAADRQKESEELARERAAMDQRCKTALERLAQFDQRGARRLATTDEKGNVSRMSEEEFKTRRAEIQQAVSENCS